MRIEEDYYKYWLLNEPEFHILKDSKERTKKFKEILKAFEESINIFSDRSFPTKKTLEVCTLSAKRIENNLSPIKIKLSKRLESQIRLNDRSQKIINKLDRIGNSMY